MAPTLLFDTLLLFALVGLFLMLSWLGPNNPSARFRAIPAPKLPRHKRSRAPKPFVGLTLCGQKTHAALRW